MTEEQFAKFCEYVDARCSYIAREQDGRDSLDEYLAAEELRKELHDLLVKP
jgi:hypothetical protein